MRARRKSTCTFLRLGELSIVHKEEPQVQKALFCCLKLMFVWSGDRSVNVLLFKLCLQYEARLELKFLTTLAACRMNDFSLSLD